MALSDERALQLFEDIGGLKAGVSQILKTLDEESEERTQLNAKLDETLTIMRDDTQVLGKRVAKLETDHIKVIWLAKGMVIVVTGTGAAIAWALDILGKVSGK